MRPGVRVSGLRAKDHNLRSLHAHAADSHDLKNQPKPVVRPTTIENDAEGIRAPPADSDDDLTPPVADDAFSDLEARPAKKRRSLSAARSKARAANVTAHSANNRAPAVEKEDEPFAPFKEMKKVTASYGGRRGWSRNIYTSAAEPALEEDVQDVIEDKRPTFKKRDISGTLASCKLPEKKWQTMR